MLSTSMMLVEAGCTSRVGRCLGQLGAGTGFQSCAAPPFRATRVHYSAGCPSKLPCCSEFGYCRTMADWEEGYIRDCNGKSNGGAILDSDAKENVAELFLPRPPAGLIGLPPSKSPRLLEAPITSKLRPLPPITHEALMSVDVMEEEEKEERAAPKSSSKEELMSFLNLLR